MNDIRRLARLRHDAARSGSRRYSLAAGHKSRWTRARLGSSWCSACSRRRSSRRSNGWCSDDRGCRGGSHRRSAERCRGWRRAGSRRRCCDDGPWRRRGTHGWRRRRHGAAGGLLIALGLLLAFLDGAQYIAGLLDARQINLGTVTVAVPVVMPGRRTAAAAALEMQTHAFCFVAFERAGVGLFLFDAHIIKDIENCPALYFKLSR